MILVSFGDFLKLLRVGYFLSRNFPAGDNVSISEETALQHPFTYLDFSICSAWKTLVF